MRKIFLRMYRTDGHLLFCQKPAILDVLTFYDLSLGTIENEYILAFNHLWKMHGMMNEWLWRLTSRTPFL